MNLTTNQLENTTSTPNDPLPAEQDSSVTGVIYLVISVLVMTANGVVIFVISMTKKLHLPTLWMILHMAVWDFLYGLSFIVFNVPSAFLNRFAYSDVVIGWVSSIQTLIMGQNLFNIAMTVLDRYIAVKYPLKYLVIATRGRCVKICLASYLLSTGRLLLIILPGLDFTYHSRIALCLSNYKTTVGQFASLLLMVVTFAIVIICSTCILLEVYQRRKGVRAHGDRGQDRDSTYKTSLMVTLLVGVCCAAYLPVLGDAIVYFTQAGTIIPWLSKLAAVTNISNSLWNVFIYTATYQPFREAFLSIFCTSYHRQQRQAEIRATFRSRPSNEDTSYHISTEAGFIPGL